jgi:phosphomannomutase
VVDLVDVTALKPLKILVNAGYLTVVQTFDAIATLLEAAGAQLT